MLTLGMELLKNKIIKNRIIIFLLLIYFSLHFPNLTSLPIFNDESIYLDWAWYNTHIPGHLYDSLLDAKQPLLVWIFGIFENFFKDSLFAGRFVSVIFGSITALGIYKLTQKLLNKQTAFITTLFYLIIPIFVFYNRQALMEASIATIGIWSFITLFNLLQNPNSKNGIILGLVLGFGFLIKSSSLIFIASTLIIVLFYAIKKKRLKIMESYIISLITLACLNFLLFINPVFWQTLPSNSRYSYTLTGLLKFPIVGWLNNIIGFFNIAFVFVTPLIFILSVSGIILMKKNKVKDFSIFIIYFILALLFEILIGKWQNQRYIVPFLIFFIIPAGYVFNILWGGNLLKKSIVIISFIIPLVLSLLVVFNPSYYITELSKFSAYSDTTYVYGQTSGYGVNEVMRYIENNSSKSTPSLIVFPLNIGNPESAVDLYSIRTQNILALHIDREFFPNLSDYNCLSSKYPIFFVTRENQQVGMDIYFSLAKKFPNPYGNYYVGVYTLKKNCVGKTLSISDKYQNSIKKLLEIKSN